IGKMTIRMHRHVPGDVVEDIRFRQIVELVGPADGNGRGELAVTQAIEEQKCRDVNADGFRFESGQRTQKTVDVVHTGSPIRTQAQRGDSGAKMLVCVFFPAGRRPGIQPSPRRVILLRIQLIGLAYIKVAMTPSILYKGSFRGRQSKTSWSRDGHRDFRIRE